MTDTQPTAHLGTPSTTHQRPYLVTRAGDIVDCATGEEVGHVHRTDYGWDARLDVPATRSYMHATRTLACDTVWAMRKTDPDQADPAQPMPEEPAQPMPDGPDCWCGADGGEGCWCCTEDCPEDCMADHQGEQ